MKPRLLDLVWLALLAATGFTWWLGTSGALAPGRWAMTALVFALAWFKGLGVLLEFMELRHAPPLWRWALITGLTVVIGLILLAAALAGRG
ncbi:MAG: cytochrome C oxidase subunit IV family protein [Desulfovibrionaceae bacterium]|nr:cytochrome C oxidase subunit IV family protein [Desulfovibrionaceae bacterium]